MTSALTGPASVRVNRDRMESEASLVKTSDPHVAVSSLIPKFLLFSLDLLDTLSTCTFVLSHNHSSHIHITAISPPPNHHSVLDVTKSCQNKWEYESSLIFLLVRS